MTVDTETAKELQEKLAANPQVTISVNLESLQIQCGDFSASVSINESTRNMFLSGSWDACGQLVANKDQIRATATKLPYTSWHQSVAS